MATLSPAEIYGLASRAGLSSAAAALATAIALAESGGRTDAIGDVALEDATWGPSVGLWQIRSLKADYGKGGARDASRLTDPQFNSFAMFELSGGGKNFTPWSTYKNGAYKAQLSKLGSLQLGTGILDSIPGLGSAVGGLVGSNGAAQAAGAAADTVSSAFSGWSGGAMKVALYVVAAASAAGLVIVGAMHTVT